MINSVNAVDIIYLFRVEGDTNHAWKLALQTDGSTDESRTYDTTETKDGGMKSPGAYEATHSITAMLAKGDEKIKELRGLTRGSNPKRLEVWEINRSDIADATDIDGVYSMDYVTNVSVSSGSSGSVEVTISTEVAGELIDGQVTVTPELLAILQTISEDQEFLQPDAVVVDPEVDPEE